MLKKIFKKLDAWLEEKNKERRSEGLLPFNKAIIRVLGQTALIEAKLELHLAATMDVDAYMQADYEVKNKLNELLREEEKILDMDSAMIWMPEETEYDDFYSGKLVTAYLAKAEYVLLSKALKAPAKNKNVLTEYLAAGPSELFQKLAEKYELDLGAFI